jgi:hypothetical protein
VLNSKDLNLMFHPDNSGSSGPLWLGDWKYQIGSGNTCTYRKETLHNEMEKIITI